MNKTLFILVILTVFSLSSFSQQLSPELVSNSGGYFVNNSSLEWSLGEISIENYNQLSEGFHQPTISILNIEEQSELDIDIFPNPTVEKINIHSSKNAKVSLSLLDVNGRIVYKEIFSKEIELNLSNQPSGIYILHLEQDNLKSTFKIQKL